MAVVTTFDEWFEMEYGRVLAAAELACGGDRHRAEDVTVDAFVVALERWDEVSEMEAPVAWTTRVAINKARRRWRRGLRRNELEVKAASADGVAPREPDIDLARTIETLPRRQRDAVMLRYLDDLTQSEVAASLDVAPGTAAATLHHAKRNLLVKMKAIGRHGI